MRCERAGGESCRPFWRDCYRFWGRRRLMCDRVKSQRVSPLEPLGWTARVCMGVSVCRRSIECRSCWPWKSFFSCSTFPPRFRSTAGVVQCRRRSNSDGRLTRACVFSYAHVSHTSHTPAARRCGKLICWQNTHTQPMCASAQAPQCSASPCVSELLSGFDIEGTKLCNAAQRILRSQRTLSRERARPRRAGN